MASQAPPNTMQKLLSVQETAEFLHVSTSTVYRYVSKGRIPSIRKGFGHRFRISDLDEWLSKDKRIDLSAPLVQTDFLTSTIASDMSRSGGEGAMAKANKKRLNCGFGSVYIRPTKSGKARFYLDYYDADGNRRQELEKTAVTWEDAALSLQQKQQAVRDKKLGVSRRRQNIGFTEFSQIYMESFAKSSKKSWKTDEFRLRKLKMFFGQDDLREITPLAIERFRSSRLSEGNTKSTVNRYLALLKKMFNLAIGEGYLDTNPACNVKMYSERDSIKERVLTAEEEAKLLDSCTVNLRPIVITALNSGMRRGEILGLQWKNGDLLKRIITVEKTKSGKTRLIPINDLLMEVLMKLRKERTGELVFPFPFRSVRTWFENACKKAGITEVTFHTLRHNFASLLISRGCDIITLQQLLGHHSVTVTQRYAHSNEDRKRQAVELLKEPRIESSCDISGTRIDRMDTEKGITPGDMIH